MVWDIRGMMLTGETRSTRTYEYIRPDATLSTTKSHVTWPAMESRPRRLETGSQLPEAWPSPFGIYIYIYIYI